jgi:hypothetical protein
LIALKVLALWIGTLVAWIFAPVIALFADGNGWLPRDLFWFQTQDAPLEPTIYGSGWWARTRWLWRNPCYGLAYYVLGLPWKEEEWTLVSWAADGSLPFRASGPAGAFAYHGSWLKLGYKAWWYFKSDLPKGNFTDGYSPLYPFMPKDVRVPFCFGP